MQRRKLLSIGGAATLGVAAFGAGLWMSGALHPLLHSHTESNTHTNTDTDDDHADVPEVLTPFEYNNVDGEFMPFSQWDNKFLLVNFWATWCGPCREEIPLLSAMQSRYENDGLQVIGLALDEVERTRLMGDELGINYPSLVPGAEVGFDLLYAYQAKGLLPFSLLVDRDRRIVSRKLGAYILDELTHELDQLVLA